MLLYPIDQPKISLFHENPKFKLGDTTRGEIPACGSCVEGPVIYAGNSIRNDLFSLYGPEGYHAQGSEGCEE